MTIMRLLGPGIILLMVFAIILLLPHRANLIMPEDNAFITNTHPTFRWEGGGTELWIDETEHFTTPIVIEAPQRVYTLTDALPVGTYYWKAPPSGVHAFTIDGDIQVELHDEGERWEIKNTGNTAINVTRRPGITGLVIAVEDEASYAKEESEFEVRQHG